MTNHIREIVLDTETTGLSIREKHRIIEIGCVELINKIRTGRYFQAYINPQRSVPEDAFAVHGLSYDFLRNKPLFSEIALEFLDFIGTDSKLVIHNAQFDMRFLNNELSLNKMQMLSSERAIDTLMMARKKFPGSPASLDALCKRFDVNLETRGKHGALIDAELLALVYVRMHSSVQLAIQLTQVNNPQKISASHKISSSLLESESASTSSAQSRTITAHGDKNMNNNYNNNLPNIRGKIEQTNYINVLDNKDVNHERRFSASNDELKLHMELLSKIKNPLWSRRCKS